MARLGMDTNQMVKTLIVATIFLFLITSVINFSAFKEGSEEDWLKEVEFQGTCSNSQYNDRTSCQNAEAIWTRGLIANVFVWLIIGIAVYLAWTVGLGGGAITRKKLIGLVVTGILLYYLYNKVLAPQLGLEDIEIAAMYAQSIISP